VAHTDLIPSIEIYCVSFCVVERSRGSRASRVKCGEVTVVCIEHWQFLSFLSSVLNIDCNEFVRLGLRFRSSVSSPIATEVYVVTVR
jgi:hypothetical protein